CSPPGARRRRRHEAAGSRGFGSEAPARDREAEAAAGNPGEERLPPGRRLRPSPAAYRLTVFDPVRLDAQYVGGRGAERGSRPGTPYCLWEGGRTGETAAFPSNAWRGQGT